MRFFGVNFILQKFCSCKKNDKYQVWVCSWSICISQVKNWECLYRLREKRAYSKPLSHPKDWNIHLFQVQGKRFSAARVLDMRRRYSWCVHIQELEKDLRYAYDQVWLRITEWSIFLSWQSKWETVSVKTYRSGNDTCKGDGGSPHVCKTEKGWTQVCL